MEKVSSMKGHNQSTPEVNVRQDQCWNRCGISGERSGPWRNVCVALAMPSSSHQDHAAGALMVALMGDGSYHQPSDAGLELARNERPLLSNCGKNNIATTAPTL
jgi:hypothetical protein